MDKNTQETTVVDSAVAEGGAYEVIRKRLVEAGSALEAKTHKLNTARQEEFGSTKMEVLGRTRVRTENNCSARDIVRVGDVLLFGYNVFIGLKKETKVADVFSLYQLEKKGEDFEIAPAETADTFLADPGFVKDFEELYAYYKDTQLLQLWVKDGKLLASFQIGDRLGDIRVFRWSISTDEQDIHYIDNRGERDIQLPSPFDFEWQATDRDDQINGRFPHVNILDKVFVETIAGDLTVKVENNTESGKGIYSEKVEEKNQSLDDADIFYAEVCQLILLKIRPYKEEQYRYLVYNPLTQSVVRIDEIGHSCVQLPEDHGIMFPGGMYLQTGEYKQFDDPMDGMLFRRMLKSPNGEDVLYVFYEPVEGKISLFSYNLIAKELQSPLFGHGYCLFEDGHMVIFYAEGEEATRVHPMQIWSTPFIGEEFAAAIPERQSFLGKIGNAELVRGISSLYSVCRLIDNQEVSAAQYTELSRYSKRLFDAYHWLESKQLDGVEELLGNIVSTSELVLDEFEKVESIQRKSAQALQDAEDKQETLLSSLRPENWQSPEEFVAALDELRHQRGHLLTIRDYRYMDVTAVQALEQAVIEAQEKLGEKTVEFLATDKSLAPYFDRIRELDESIENAVSIMELTPHADSLNQLAAGLDLLSELVATLKVQDATVRTRIIESISEVYALVNQSKARTQHKEKSLGSAEAVAQFGAQFKLFSQSVSNALGLATTPEKCDEQLSRLLVQLEELEGQFGSMEEFLADIFSKREEVYESFEEHKQRLIEARQRKARTLMDAAERIIKNVIRRSQKFTEIDEVNTYFASDALIIKARELAETLRELDEQVKADEVESKLKSAKDQSVRSLRDKSEIFEDGGNIIKLGPRHRFSVNKQDLDLTIIPRDGELNVHLTGTNFFEPIAHDDLEQLKKYWDQSLESETDDLSRAEYLAAQLVALAKAGEEGFRYADLKDALADEKALMTVIRQYTSARYKEGYDKGIHDHDAALILQQLIPVLDNAELLRFAPQSRALAALFWAAEHEALAAWTVQAVSAAQMREVYQSNDGVALQVAEAEQAMVRFVEAESLGFELAVIKQAAEYLVEELALSVAGEVALVRSRYASELLQSFQSSMQVSGAWQEYKDTLNKLADNISLRWAITRSWLSAHIENISTDGVNADGLWQGYIAEAAAALNVDELIKHRESSAELEFSVENMMSEHIRIIDRSLNISLDDYLARVAHHRAVVIPGYHYFLDTRQSIVEDEKSRLKLEEFKAKPLTSFVRNRLLNEVYLPVIGDNLAKQMGTVGEKKRTDLMGLLMMISPPGYGKTTLMEYVASRLGLVFMKINCPSLGHDVLSLDPETAPNATSRQELEKLNLGLEMGNNVMLYLDDIQHTNPEFLQKFISLCDGTRRIEGVWKGKTKTYDMRGKKFCVVMAGNPYTESGDVFSIPDMLANRADIYNLGDILGGAEEAFELSYIENSLTSNAVLAPLSNRDMADIYRFINLAQGKEVSSSDFSHSYSAAESSEIVSVLQKMFEVQKVILKVNQQYIKSAAQDDKYRQEPPFKLQGSYRNMNKMAEKLSAVMNDEELMTLIADHYVGESQLLTTGSEENLLKLAELRGNMTADEQQRWEQIKQAFLRDKAMGGDGADVGTRVVGQLVDMGEHLKQVNASIAESGSNGENTAKQIARLGAVINKRLTIGDELEGLSQAMAPFADMSETLSKLSTDVKQLAGKQAKVEVINEAAPELEKTLKAIAATFKNSILPLVKIMDGKLDLDLNTHSNMALILEEIRELDKGMEKLKKPVSKKKVAKPKPE